MEKNSIIRVQSERLISNKHSKSSTEFKDFLPKSIITCIPLLKFKNVSQPASPEVTCRVQNMIYSERNKETSQFNSKKFTKDISHLLDTHKRLSSDRDLDIRFEPLEPLQAQHILPINLDKLKFQLNYSQDFKFTFSDASESKTLGKSPISFGRPSGKQDIENLKISSS